MDLYVVIIFIYISIDLNICINVWMVFVLFLLNNILFEYDVIKEVYVNFFGRNWDF